MDMCDKLRKVLKIENSGFTLVEVMVALAISVSAVLVAGSGMISVLRMESAGMRKADAVLLLRSIECTEVADEASVGILSRVDEEWAILKHQLDEGDNLWTGWQMAPKDRRSSTWSVFFSRTSDRGL